MLQKQLIFLLTSGGQFAMAERGHITMASGGQFKPVAGGQFEWIFHYYIRKTNIIPDFIVIDGAEGGTGAAPLEFTDNVGMPLYEALTFTAKALQFYGLKEQIKLIASGKIISGFDILKVLALGASACYSSRGMMFSLGCIQALQCDSGKCPVGVATQNPALYKGLDVSDKRVRVASFHNNTIKATIELMEACGFKDLSEVDFSSFYRRLDALNTKNFGEIYGLNTNTSSKTFDSISNYGYGKN